MKIITKEVHDDLQEYFNDTVWGKGILTSFLYYFMGHGKKAYTSAKCVHMTNTGIRVEVDGKELDYLFTWKYAWRFSSLNQKTNHEDPKEVFAEMVQDGKRLARLGENAPPKWKTMSMNQYTNGLQGESFNRYNTYTGSKANFKYT